MKSLLAASFFVVITQLYSAQLFAEECQENTDGSLICVGVNQIRWFIDAKGIAKNQKSSTEGRLDTYFQPKYYWFNSTSYFNAGMMNLNGGIFLRTPPISTDRPVHFRIYIKTYNLAHFHDCHWGKTIKTNTPILSYNLVSNNGAITYGIKTNKISDFECTHNGDRYTPARECLLPHGHPLNWGPKFTDPETIFFEGNIPAATNDLQLTISAPPFYECSRKEGVFFWTTNLESIEIDLYY